MRLIDADVLSTAYEDTMKELLQATNVESISLEALSLLCGAKLIAEAPTVGGWINVKDKLPEKNGAYLVVTSFFDRRRIEVLTFVHDLEKLDSYDFHGKKRPGFADYDLEFGFSERRVSHWMPLPEMPKKEEM